MLFDDAYNFDIELSEGEEGWIDINDQIANKNVRKKRITPKMREDLIKWLQGQKGNMSIQMMAVGLGVTTKRIIDLRKQYVLTGDIKVTAMTRHSQDYYRRKALQSQVISNAIRADPSISLRGIQQKLEEESFYISLGCISVTLKRLGFLHRNTPVKMLEIRNQEQIMEERYDFAHWLEGHKNDDIYYTGQCTIQTDNLSRSTDVRRVGGPNPEKSESSGFSISLHLTVGINGIVGWNARKHSHTLKSFINHITHNYLLIRDQKDTLLCDNSRIHCSDEFRKLSETKKIRVRFIPPNSRYLNPLQSIFNDIKFELKKLSDAYQVEDMDHIHELLEQILEQYPDNSIQKFYCQMREAAKRCKKRQRI